MEVLNLNGVVINTTLRNINNIAKTTRGVLCFNRNNVCLRKNNINNNNKSLVVNCVYENKGHLEYYDDGNDKGNKGKKTWNGVSSKKKMKLLKGLVKDLNTFEELGFGLRFGGGDDDDDDDDDKSMAIHQAAEVLLAQLKQLRSEEEKQKKKEKEEKKKCKKGDCDSSSSESSSSDSECDEVVDMKRLRNVPVVQSIETKETHSSNDVSLSATSSLLALKGSGNELTTLNLDQDCCNMILETTLNKEASIEVLKQSNMGKKIEVCMGGKCKKSGAPGLIEVFQKAVGDEGVVVGCKCMGKCKSGPNVKVVSNGVIGENVDVDSLRTPTNPLYIGVDLGDVDLIVARYFGEEMKGLGPSIASTPSLSRDCQSVTNGVYKI